MAKEDDGMMAPEGGGMDEESEAMKPEGEDEDEGGDEAAQRSALSDFLSAIGVKPKKMDEALSAFKELMKLCDYDEGE